MHSKYESHMYGGSYIALKVQLDKCNKKKTKKKLMEHQNLDYPFGVKRFKI